MGCAFDPNPIKLQTFPFPSPSSAYLLASIQQNILKTPCYLLLLDNEYIISILQEHQNYYFNPQLTTQTIQLILNYLSLSKNHLNQNETLNTKFNLLTFASKFGQQWLKIKTEAFFQNKYTLKILNYICRKQKQNQQYDHCFLDFEFNLSIEESRKVAKVVKQQCRYELNAFCFLTNYLYLSCINLQKKGVHIKEIQKHLQDTLKTLAEQNPPAPPLDEVQQLLKTHKNFKMQNMELYLKGINIQEHPSSQKILTLDRFISERAHQANQVHEKFKNLVRDICLRDGYHFRSGVKIKNMQDSRAVQRVKQKLLNQHFQKYTLEQELKKYPKATLQDYTSHEIQAYELELSQIYNKIQEPIVFKVTDMTRGKCMYSSIDKINKTCADIIKQIQKSGYKLIQIDNRLRGKTGTSDIVLKILIGETIAQLQIVIDLNVSSYEFSHKIYELMRSKFFTTLTMLKIYNEQISIKFIESIIGFVRVNVKSKEENNYKQKCTYKDVEKYLASFIDLIPVDKNKLVKSDEDNKIIFEHLIQRFNMVINHPVKENVKIGQLLRHQNNANFKFKIKQYAEVIRQTEKYLQKFQMIYPNLVKKQVDINSNFTQQQQQKLLEHAEMQRMLGKVYESKGMMDNAIAQYKEVIKFIKEKSIPDKQMVSKLQFNISWLHYKKGNYDEALEIYEKILKQQQLKSGKKTLDYASTLNNIGLVYGGQGNYHLSLQYYHKSLEIREQILGKENIECVSTLNNIGLVYNSMGNSSQALRYYQKCLDIKQRVKGKDTTDCALTLNNIGMVYSSEGKFQEAMKVYQRSIDIRQKIKGKDSIDSTSAMNNMGILLRRQGQFQKAMELFDRSLRIRVKTNGKGTQESSICLLNKGLVLTRMKRFKDSQECLDQCMKIRQKTKETENIGVANCNQAYSQLYYAMKDYHKALEYCEKSLKTSQKLLGKDSVENMEAYITKGMCYRQLGQYDKCKDNFQITMSLVESKRGKGHITSVEIYNQFGYLYLRQGYVEDAEKHFKQAYSICEKNHYKWQQYGNCCKGFGLIYFSQQKYEEALKMFKKAVPLLLKFNHDIQEVQGKVLICEKELRTS